ncbi:MULTISPECIES: molybdenum cofactor biosynthesis protein B [unclassified Paenibacillus]|uniref:Molybdenum cofactor biosynthesis protein B n=1 Tax=Paenibacillus provencensis TaxID=441151 RepID=A0ABW3PVM7_9BACL|nr:MULTISPECIES: molybdenum cofactor biosynthesis protein B [unclassified Paenibacillus]MCM3128801.1 molybdenum cofactor biosynthesis protein MoaB [Paenibacillus sp. MER 78]
MEMNSVQEHRNEAPETVQCMVITVSDTRTKDTDTGGQLMQQLLRDAGYTVVDDIIIPDDTPTIQSVIHQAVIRDDIEAILLTGGTGISPRDNTYEAVHSLLDKELPGFGEIFRYLSFAEDIGTAAILSRAVAGVIGSKAIFSMPGSTGAVKLAITRIIAPELGHVMREIYKIK